MSVSVGAYLGRGLVQLSLLVCHTSSTETEERSNERHLAVTLLHSERPTTLTTVRVQWLKVTVCLYILSVVTANPTHQPPGSHCPHAKPLDPQETLRSTLWPIN